MFVPYKRKKRDGRVDDELHKKFSQSKCAKLSLSSAAGDKAEDATGMQLLYHYAIDIARFLQLLKWNGFRILTSCEMLPEQSK